MSQFLVSGGQSIRVSASASVLPMNIQDLSPLRWTGQISLQSKGLSSVFYNTSVQKHQFLGARLSSQSSSHIRTCYRSVKKGTRSYLAPPPPLHSFPLVWEFQNAPGLCRGLSSASSVSRITQEVALCLSH